MEPASRPINRGYGFAGHQIDLMFGVECFGSEPQLIETAVASEIGSGEGRALVACNRLVADHHGADVVDPIEHLPPHHAGAERDSARLARRLRRTSRYLSDRVTAGRGSAANAVASRSGTRRLASSRILALPLLLRRSEPGGKTST